MCGKLPLGASSLKRTVWPSRASRVALRQHPGERRQRVGPDLRIGEAVERLRHVLCGHPGAVVELHPLADLERPHAAVMVGLPAGGDLRMQRQVAVREHQELAVHPEHREPALVGDLDRVDRRRRGHDSRPDRPSRLGAWVWGGETLVTSGRAHPAITTPSAESDMPSAVPRRMNSRRPIRSDAKLVDQMVLDLPCRPADRLGSLVGAQTRQRQHPSGCLIANRRCGPAHFAKSTQDRHTRNSRFRTVQHLVTAEILVAV